MNEDRGSGATGFVLIDLQMDYFPNGKMELKGREAAVDIAARLLSFFRRDHAPVFHIQHISLRPGAAFFLPGTPGIEIHAGVRPIADEPIIQKHFPNSFRETTLLSHYRLRRSVA